MPSNSSSLSDELSTSLRDEGAGAHNPPDADPVEGELLRDPVGPLTTLPRDSFCDDLRCSSWPMAAFAELLRLVVDAKGSLYEKGLITGPPELLNVEVRPRVGWFQTFPDLAETGVEDDEVRKCSVLADMRVSYILSTATRGVESNSWIGATERRLS